MTLPKLTLISHHLCPYVQRAAIVLDEKAVSFERVYIDLRNKPDWFLALSPLGKTPVLLVDDRPIFESSVILEYLEDTIAPALHPVDAFQRADHRAWVEFGSAILNDIAGLYSATDRRGYETAIQRLQAKFKKLDDKLTGTRWFDGEAFSLVDAVFGPVFRYFDTFERVFDLHILDGLEKTGAWRRALTERPSVKSAVAPDYSDMLTTFLLERRSYLAQV